MYVHIIISIFCFAVIIVLYPDRYSSCLDQIDESIHRYIPASCRQFHHGEQIQVARPGCRHALDCSEVPRTGAVSRRLCRVDFERCRARQNQKVKFVQ